MRALRDALFRHSTRFSQFQKSLGIATNILTSRLEHLVVDPDADAVAVREPGRGRVEGGRLADQPADGGPGILEDRRQVTADVDLRPIVERAFETSFARLPTGREVEASIQFIEAQTRARTERAPGRPRASKLRAISQGVRSAAPAMTSPVQQH